MAKYYSVLSMLLGAFLMPGCPLILARDIPTNDIFLVEEPHEHYYLIKRTPVTIKCRAMHAAEIFFTCKGTQVPETSVEAEDVSDIDPGLIQAKIEVTRADVQNYEGNGPFWCTCSAVDFGGLVAATSRRGYVSVAFLRNKFTVKQAPITATVNEDVKIVCGAPEGYPHPELIWRKDKKKLQMDNNPRLSVTDEGALLIHSVTTGDQGLYQCVLKNLVGRLESTGALLKVIALEESSEPQVAISKAHEGIKEEVDPSKARTTRQTYKTYFITEPEEKYYVTESKPLLIDCSVVAADILTFRCNGKRMNRDRQLNSQGLDEANNRNIKSQLNLTYADVQKIQAETGDSSQTFQCTCIAWFQDSGSPNGWGRLDSKSGLGFVYLAYLDDDFEEEPSDVTAAPNTHATMVCEPPQGDPYPWVYWYKDGSRLDPRSSNKYVVNAKGHLKIHNVQREDAGAYHCVVENIAKTVQSKMGLLTVIETTEETATAGQPDKDDIPEFPEVIPSTPIFLRDFQPEYTIAPDGTRTMACAVISAEQLTMDCGGTRLADGQFELRSKVHQESGKKLLYAKTEVDAKSVSQKPDTYFCQCTAWSLNEQRSWEEVISAKGYVKLGAARTVYIEDVFVVAPEDTDAYYEADAKLVCKPPKGSPTPEVHWLKDGVRIDSDVDPNYVIIKEELFIEFVRVSDEGQYTCVAENEAGTRSSKPARLTVLGKPEATTASATPEEASHKTELSFYPKSQGPFFSMQPDSNYYIVREQPVNLSCTVIAATSLVFVCNGEVVQSTIETDIQTWDSNIKASINKNSLVVTKEDVDLHTGSEPYACVCRAHYVEDDTRVTQDTYVDSSQAQIQVAFLQNHFLEEPSDTRVTYFGTAELVCKAPNGIPEPEVYWLKNGFKIPLNERIQVKGDGNLVINSFTEEDEGTYRCVAENLLTSKTSRAAIVSLSGDEQDVITDPDVGDTSHTAPPELESTTQGVVQIPYFDTPYISKDLQPEYFLVTDKPVTIMCEAYDIEYITFTCGMQSVEDLTVHARVEQQVRSDGQIAAVNVFEASVNLSKEKVESYEAEKEYSCQCFAHYRVSATGEYQMLNSTKAVVQIAYLNEQFEQEPESHTVTEGSFLTIGCNPPRGHPEPKVSWLRDGESFESVNIVQNTLLVFTDIKQEHTGEYNCVAENVAGKRQSSPIFLDVKAKSDGSLTKGDSDVGVDEFGVYKESDEEPGTNVTEETGSTKSSSMDGDVKEPVDEEAAIKIDVGKIEQQHEDNITEEFSARNVSRQSKEDQQYLVKNQVLEEIAGGYPEEYETGDVDDRNGVNTGTGQKSDVTKCEQMQLQCLRFLPGNSHDQDMCLVLPQYISCIKEYISSCRGVIDDDTLYTAHTSYESAQVKCSLQSKCPQLERCARVSSAVTRNRQTVEQFCKHNTLEQCVEQGQTACKYPLSPETEAIKSNLYDVYDWLADFCERVIEGKRPLAGCDQMMACDLHIEQMANDNSTSWCKLISSLVECTNSAVSKCQLNELRNDLEELHSDARHILCSEDDMAGQHTGPFSDITPEANSDTTPASAQVTQNDRLTGKDVYDEDEDDSEITAIEGGAAASKEGSENASTILCAPVLLAAILQLLILTLNLR